MEKEQNNPNEPQNEPIEAEETATTDHEQPAEPQTAHEQGAKVAAELAEMKDKYLRLYSDFENFRRRTAKEKIEFVKTAGESILTSLLPVLDDFERAQKSMGELPEEAHTLKEGFDIIYHKFKKTLENKGLKPMGDLKGADFDSELHEAITQIPAPDASLKGKIVDVVEQGYWLEEKVIRFAKVVVGA